MPRPRKAADPTAAPKPPTRAVCADLIRRFLKEGQTIYWAREMPVFYRLWKLYPSLPFWQHYQLPFGNQSLNMMGWFEREEGVTELQRAWLLFNWNPDAETQPSIEPPALDTNPPSPLSYPLPPRKPRTIAEWLKR